eukprot:2456333-Amphidinium_carterae.1
MSHTTVVQKSRRLAHALGHFAAVDGQRLPWKRSHSTLDTVTGDPSLWVTIVTWAAFQAAAVPYTVDAVVVVEGVRNTMLPVCRSGAACLELLRAFWMVGSVTTNAQ